MKAYEGSGDSSLRGYHSCVIQHKHFKKTPKSPPASRRHAREKRKSGFEEEAIVKEGGDCRIRVVVCRWVSGCFRIKSSLSLNIRKGDKKLNAHKTE